jgi:chromosomal replication initiator protein
MNSENLNNIWNEFLNKIQEKLQPVSFDIWFKDTKLIELNNNTAKVLVQSVIYKKTILRNYNQLVEEIFTEITGTNFKFEYVTESEIENNISLNPDDFGVPTNALFETNLNEKYTFDNFITGPSSSDKNTFSKAIAISVAENPGQMYNPLYIYGKSGLGKTHLMHAIGNYIVANSNKKVLYVSSETFVDDFMQIYRKKSENNSFNDDISLFKKKYRDLDVLIIDDIQYLEAVGGIQQEFFNTFNELYNNEKQIILSSDRSPDDIKKLEERLKTRFNWGLQVDILPPDFNLRMSIINKKLDSKELSTCFPTDVKEYIASNCVGDIRKLEGALTRVFAYATIMNGSEINLNLAIDALKDYFVKTIVAQNKIDQVIQLVGDHYNLSSEDLKSKKRTNKIAIPRMIAMYICRIYLNENLVKIGLEFGGKNHTTVMHAVDKIKKDITNNEELNNEIQKIVDKIKVC